MSKASNYQLLTVFSNSVLHVLICDYINTVHFSILCLHKAEDLQT